LPRNVRNFWATIDVDGRSSRVAVGPRSKTGGFSLNIKMRDEGSVSDLEINLWGRVVQTADGEYLKLTIDEESENGSSEIYSVMKRRATRGKND